VAVRAFVDEAYHSAYKILEDNGDIMHRMATALLERETLDKSEIDLLIERQGTAAVQVALAFADPGPGDGQKVVKPEPGPAGRKPGFPEGQPSPA